MILRPYQEKIIAETCLNLKRSKSQLIVLPTGSGKTVVFASIIKNMSLKALVLAHTNELIQQNRKTISLINKDVPYDVMTVQSASRRLDFLRECGFELIIVDECHRSAAVSYQKIFDAIPSAKLLGVTATPFREDGKKITSIFGHPTCSLSIIDMINEGFLCDFEGYRVTTSCSIRGVKRSKGDFQVSSLAPVINVKNRNQLIVREYQKIALDQKTLCFAINIAHAEELAKEFREKGISSYAVHGKLSDKERERRLKDFKDGKITVLTNCQILTEGFDEPSVACLLMARPTRSKTLYTQMIGRGARLFPGKSACKVIEYTDNAFDVCLLEDLSELPKGKKHMLEGERLSLYEKRISKELEDESHETVIERLDITKKTSFETPASEWQRNFLTQKGIQFVDPLSEWMANHLIGKAYGKH